jgi:glycosyltransferase involved in cell wall biosynthesis
MNIGYGIKTPVVLIVFNRPARARITFETIRAARPPKLIIVADGPRSDRPGEAEKCAATRAIVDTVDWDCELVRVYADSNMGCKMRVATGISTAFEYVDRAIILEDDCVPSASFFRFCEEMLDRYADDDRVMVVSGDNQLFGAALPDESYYFSRYAHLWGWATWRRSWSLCDIEMEKWPGIRKKGLLNQYFHRVSERYYWDSLLQYVFEGNIDTWDYQWVFSIWANNGLCVVPAKNLVRNIGFDVDATHTKYTSAYANLEAENLDFPLRHPEIVMARWDLDEIEARCRIAHSGGLPYPLNKYASLIKRVLRRKRRV